MKIPYLSCIVLTVFLCGNVAGQNSFIHKLQKLTSSISCQVDPQAYQARPIPAGENAETWHTVQNLSNQVFKRQLIEDLQRTAQNAEGLNTLSSFVEDYADHYRMTYLHAEEYGRTPLKTVNKLLKTVRALKDQYGQHPALLLCEIELVDRTNFKHSEYIELGEEGFNLSVKHQSNPYIQYAFGWKIQRESPSHAQQVKYRAIIDGLAVPMLRSEYYQVGEEREAMLRFSKHWKLIEKEEQRDFVNRLKDNGAILPAVVIYADGCAHITEGWAARGGGWASTVTKVGGEQFHLHLEQARKLLTEGWETYPGIPEFAQKMITVAMAAAVISNEERMWFDRVVIAQMDYLPGYSSLEWALYPRWGGSHTQMLAFATECLDTGRFDTAVPMRYTSLVNKISRDTDDFSYEQYKEEPISTNLRRVADGYLNNEESILKGSRRGAHLFAAQSVYSEDYQFAHQILSEIDYQLNYMDMQLFQDSYGFDTAHYIELSAAYGGTAAEEIREADRLLAQGQYEHALMLYNEILEDPTFNMFLRSYLKNKIALAQFRENARSGEWIDVFKPDMALPWVGKNLIWGQDQGKNLVVQKQSNWWWLPAEVDFKQGFEMEFSFQFEQKNHKSLAILYFGNPQQSKAAQDAIWFRPTKEQLIVVGMNNNEVETYKLPDTDQYQVVITVSDGVFSLHVNGVEIVTELPFQMATELNGVARLGFGDGRSGWLRKKLKVQKISIKHPMVSTDAL